MRNSLSPLLLGVVSCLPGCDTPPPVPEGWKTFAVGTAFTFKGPPDLTPVPVQGIDSQVGKYTSPSLVVEYDYGWYSDPLDQGDYTSRRWVTVDGKDARLVSKADVVAIHFPRVVDKMRLTVYARLTGADPKLAETLLRSVEFP